MPTLELLYALFFPALLRPIFVVPQKYVSLLNCRCLGCWSIFAYKGHLYSQREAVISIQNFKSVQSEHELQKCSNNFIFVSDASRDYSAKNQDSKK